MSTPKLHTCSWVSLQRVMTLQQRKVDELQRTDVITAIFPRLKGESSRRSREQENMVYLAWEEKDNGGSNFSLQLLIG